MIWTYVVGKKQAEPQKRTTVRRMSEEIDPKLEEEYKRRMEEEENDQNQLNFNTEL